VQEICSPGVTLNRRDQPPCSRWEKVYQGRSYFCRLEKVMNKYCFEILTSCGYQEVLCRL
jgi:hypothetical protein